ncbi:zf-TFIIB domain-containing protein [bacterium]|nr:zf-TFIIB domain-containing protein [bacterium]
MAKKPSDKEEEFFAQQEAKKRKQLEQKKYEEMKEIERRQLKELHFMKCPKCGMNLEEINYFNIKIDRCTHCHGVWLDHGELEAISRYRETGFLKNLFNFSRDSNHKNNDQSP